MSKGKKSARAAAGAEMQECAGNGRSSFAKRDEYAERRVVLLFKCDAWGSADGAGEKNDVRVTFALKSTCPDMGFVVDCRQRGGEPSVKTS
jgi:hypothetical protein